MRKRHGPLRVDTLQIIPNIGKGRAVVTMGAAIAAAFLAPASAFAQTDRALTNVEIACQQAHPIETEQAPETPAELKQEADYQRCLKRASVPRYGPPPPPLPPLGWVFYRYAPCADEKCSTLIVNVGADGLNVRVSPNGYPIVALVNGTPLIPLQRQADWVLVAPACDLTPTFAWSWTAGVSLARCWVWFP
jgi:hypothetical protein